MVKQIFVTCIFFFCSWILFPQVPKVYAQQGKVILHVTPKTTVTTPTPTVRFSDYILAYPGMLADNPLYIFKKIRDYLVEVFISDPYKKIEFFILQSDKYTSMANIFYQNGKVDMGNKSLTDAQIFTEKGMRAITKRKEEVLTVPTNLMTTMEDSLYSHAQILNAINDTPSNWNKTVVSAALDQVQSWIENIKLLQQ